MEYLTITAATKKEVTTFDGSEILLDIELTAEHSKQICKHILYSGTLLCFHPNSISEDLDYFIAIIDKKIPLNEKNTWLRDNENLAITISSSNHTLEREKIRNLFNVD